MCNKAAACGLASSGPAGCLGEAVGHCLAKAVSNVCTSCCRYGLLCAATIMFQLVAGGSKESDALAGHEAMAIVRNLPLFAALAIEVAVATTHAVASAIAYRSPRMLFEVTATWTHRRHLRAV